MAQTGTRDDPYAILGVARGSSDRQIAAAHRALARRFHPDIAGDAATPQMMRINAAFDAIRTIERRLAFDDATGAGGSDAATDGGQPRRPERQRPQWRPTNDGTGGAGPPPGRPSGSVLPFGRHKGWSIGEVARVDPGYLQWLEGRREGRPYLDEIAATLDRVGYRPRAAGTDDDRPRRRGVFRRG